MFITYKESVLFIWFREHLVCYFTGYMKLYVGKIYTGQITMWFRHYCWSLLTDGFIIV